MTINELIDRAHSNAKAKGFWDQERNTGELLMLIVSECGEALEAHRKGKRANLHSFDYNQGFSHYITFPDKRIADFPGHFRKDVKDTFEDELADIVIRIADLLGGIPKPGEVGGVLSEFTKGDPWEEFPVDEIPENIGETLLEVTICISACWKKGGLSREYIPELLGAMCAVKALAKKHGIDLERHIELKMAYNETRERLHGKKY